MLASQIGFEQSSIELIQENSPTYQTCVDNIVLHGAENIVAKVHNASSPERFQLEQFVKVLFKATHDANIHHFMPDLLALNKLDGALMAVCGLRKASQEKLFLERYLNSNIEETISAIADEAVSRDAITEIGNLAAAKPEDIRLLLTCINLYLHKSNTDWAVFTGIRSLKNALIKLNIPVLTLGSASINCIAESERSDWGSYYAENPEVMAIKRITQVG